MENSRRGSPPRELSGKPRSGSLAEGTRHFLELLPHIRVTPDEVLVRLEGRLSKGLPRFWAHFLELATGLHHVVERLLVELHGERPIRSDEFESRACDDLTEVLRQILQPRVG